MKFFEIDGYKQVLHDNGNIICDCIHGSLYPSNYFKGEKLCRHIKKLMTKLKNETKKRSDIK